MADCDPMTAVNRSESSSDIGIVRLRRARQQQDEHVKNVVHAIPLTIAPRHPAGWADDEMNVSSRGKPQGADLPDHVAVDDAEHDPEGEMRKHPAFSALQLSNYPR